MLPIRAISTSLVAAVGLYFPVVLVSLVALLCVFWAIEMAGRSIWQSVSGLFTAINPFGTATPESNVVEGGEFSAEAVIDDAYNRHVTQHQPALVDERLPPVTSVFSNGEAYRPAPRPRVRLPLHSTGLYDQSECEEAEQVPFSSEMDPVARDSVMISPQESQTEALLKTLICQFTEAVRGVQKESSGSAAPSHRVELRAPRFDGTSDVHLFVKQFAEVAQLSGWADRVSVVQLRASLDKGAKDCGCADTLQGIYSQLLTMYGLSPAEARERLHSLKREPGESYLRLGNRVERLARLAYGGLGVEVETVLALEHFDRALDDPALRQHLLAVRASTLDVAVKAAEQYALVSRVPTRPPRNRDCHARLAAVQEPCYQSVARNAASDSMVQGPNPDDKMARQLERLATLVEQQTARVSALEESQGKNYKPLDCSNKERYGRRCYECGALFHIRRNCPQLKGKQIAVDTRKPSSRKSEN